MVQVWQSNPELEPVWGFDNTMLWNVMFFYIHYIMHLRYICNKNHSMKTSGPKQFF